jgi:exopolysaccharide production protein ExoZ
VGNTGKLAGDAPDDGKIEAIQLLRAVAAATVAVLHLAFAFADHIGPGLGLGDHRHGSSGQIAVALFFIVSGHVMLVASRRLFGQAGAVRTFWTRRLVRILPSYWFASVLLGLVFLALGQAVEPGLIIASFFLLPIDSDAFIGRPLFFLWPGWTLFYELVFYLIFGIGIAVGRRFAVLVVAVSIAALVGIGASFETGPAWLVSLTRPVLLLFLAGLVLAVFRDRGGVMPAWSRWLAAMLAGITWWLLPAPSDPAALGFDYLLWAGLPAVLLAVALLGGPLRVPFFPLVDRFGDASYALYLLHVPLAHAWINLFPLRLGAWPFLISLVGLVYGISLLGYRHIERPMLRWLNARLASTPQRLG